MSNSPIVGLYGLDDVFPNKDLDFLPMLHLGEKDYSISLFPELPKDDSREKFPDVVENRILERMDSPTSKGDANSFPISIRCVHHEGALILDVKN
jgi:hypothetical protein